MANNKTWKRIMSGVCALAMVMGCTGVPVYAMDDMTEPNPTISDHPTGTMNPTKVVTPIGSKTFYKIQGDKVVYADRDDGTGWVAVPSAYISGSSYNVANVEYGMYVVNTTEVRFVELSECKKDAVGSNYTYYHGTKDSATVSSDVDTATNADPSMGTDFYIHVENGIDPDGIDKEEVVKGETNDKRVEYEITVSTKTTYQLKATVPMYVCMYGYRGTGNVLTPDKDAYKLKNYSTINENDTATIVDITKLTHYAKIYDENHSDEKIHTIGYNTKTGKYTYWYSKPTQLEIDQAIDGGVYLDISTKNINASGECYVIYIDGKWDFKVAGIMDGDAYRQSVSAIDPLYPLKTEFKYGSYNFKTSFSVGDSLSGGTNTGMALKVTEIQAEPATWRLVSLNTSSSNMKRGELAMSIAPEKAISDASAIDLSTVSAKTDITEKGWYLPAPATVQANGQVAEADATALAMNTYCRMAGGNVNAAGCTSVVKMTYTLTPIFSAGDSETGTVSGDAVTGNRT